MSRMLHPSLTLDAGSLIVAAWAVYQCWSRLRQQLGRRAARSLPALRAAPPGCAGARARVPRDRALSLEDLPARIRDVEYAVRGEVDIAAQALAERLRRPRHGLPFDEVVPCNIGNPQVLGQQPITFHRQLLSVLVNPASLPEHATHLPGDVAERALHYLSAGKLGAYSHSKGAPLLRRHVAEFIERRDGLPAGPVDVESIYLTDGASAGVKLALSMLIRDADDGLLIPIPQYPLYSAAITSLGGTVAGYYLDEAAGWAVSSAELERAADRFYEQRPGGRLRAFLAINPGNPTGNVMSEEEMQSIVRLCERHKLVLLADEVYQENIWSDRKWTSFRKVVREMRAPVELISFHSISKGYFGECGFRGGFMHLENIDAAVQEQLYKMVSITLCANTLGQAMTASMLNPPLQGEPSFPCFELERSRILQSMRRKASMLVKRLNSLPGMSCQPIAGALYAFPSLDLPPAAVDAAELEGRTPDLFYCLALLQATGIAVVPGSGFQQAPGTWHFRMTILPSEDKLPAILNRLEAFHRNFLKQYGFVGADCETAVGQRLRRAGA